jgi:hypoxanthine phosphoribosyltransferase
MSPNEPVADLRLKGRPVARIVFSEEEIAIRVKELGNEISEFYLREELLVLGLLKGSFIFVSDLVRNINVPLQVDFVMASSYGAGTVSGGEVRLTYDPETNLAGRNILLVEDVVDSGRTLERLERHLRTRQPKSLEICALLHKNLAGVMRPRFVGFDAPDEFLVGYGLDHAEDFRHLPYVASLV